MVQSWLSPTVKTRPSVFDRVKLEAIKVERLISLITFRFFVTVSTQWLSMMAKTLSKLVFYFSVIRNSTSGGGREITKIEPIIYIFPTKSNAYWCYVTQEAMERFAFRDRF